MKERFQGSYGLSNLLFDVMWVLFLACRIFDISAWGALNYVQYFDFYRILKYVLAALCVAVIVLQLFQRKYSQKAVIGYVLLGTVILLASWFSNDHTYIWYYLMFAAAWQQDGKRVVFLSACVIGIMLVFLVVTSLTGIGIDYIFDATTRARHGLGFGWTTSGPVLYFFFLLQYVFLREERMRWFEYVILEAVAVFFFWLTNTNLTFFFSTGILIFFFIEGKFPRRWRFWSKLKWLWILLPVIICAVTLVVFLLYHPDHGLWSRMNSLIHGRLSLGKEGLQNYGITLFGQPIEWHGYYITALDVPDYNFIDCSYLYLLLEFGLFFLLAVLAIYTRAMAQAVKKNQYYLVWALAAVLLFSVMEPRLMELIYNIFPILAFTSLDQKNLSFLGDIRSSD